MSKKEDIRCNNCGSDSLIFDGTCRWNVDMQDYEIVDIGDAFCPDCEDENADLNFVDVNTTPAERLKNEIKDMQDSNE